jgi:GNAT superfamily N-acetyltransferase
MSHREEPTLTILGPECLDMLEPLWLALFDHHHSIGAASLPEIDRSETWPRRRQVYERLFEDPDTFAVVAELDGSPVGYAMCHVQDFPDDTWQTTDRIGIVETLSLLPDVRGQGTGTELMDAAEGELARRGAGTIMTAVMEGNDQARAFYLRRGMTPTVTYLMRPGPRSGHGGSSVSEPG